MQDMMGGVEQEEADGNVARKLQNAKDHGHEYPKTTYFLSPTFWQKISLETHQTSNDMENLRVFIHTFVWKDFGSIDIHECGPGDCQKTRLLLDWMDKSLVSTRVSLFDVHNEPPRRFSYQHVSVLYEQATIDEALKRYAEESSRVQFNIFLGSSPLTNDDPDLVVERLEKWGKLGYLLVSQDHKPDGLGFKCDAYHTPAYEAFMRRGLEVGDEILGTDWFKHCKQTCHIVEEPTWYHYMAFKHPDGGEFPAFKSYKFSESELVNLFEIAGLSVLWKRQEGTMGMYLLIGRSVDAKLLPSWVADKLAQPLGIDI